MILSTQLYSNTFLSCNIIYILHVWTFCIHIVNILKQYNISFLKLYEHFIYFETVIHFFPVILHICHVVWHFIYTVNILIYFFPQTVWTIYIFWNNTAIISISTFEGQKKPDHQLIFVPKNSLLNGEHNGLLSKLTMDNRCAVLIGYVTHAHISTMDGLK